MKNLVITITPFDHVPFEPAPFFANGKPSWVAVLGESDAAGIRKICEGPSKKFVDEIKEVRINGERIYPKS